LPHLGALASSKKVNHEMPPERFSSLCAPRQRAHLSLRISARTRAWAGREKVNEKVRFGYGLNYLIDYEHG
jgi:hypothetical protein